MSVRVRVSVNVDGGQAGPRAHGPTGPRAHAGTPNGPPGAPILDPGTPNLSQAGDEARGQGNSAPFCVDLGPYSSVLHRLRAILNRSTSLMPLCSVLHVFDAILIRAGTEQQSNPKSKQNGAE